MNFKTQIQKWSFAPTAHGEWEIFLMRLSFAAVLWFRMPTGGSFSSQPSPNGIAQWLNLTFLANQAIFEPLRWMFLGMLLLYISGRAMAVALPYLLFLNIAVFTLGNSQGWIGHTDQIISLVLLTQTIFHVFRALQSRVKKNEITNAAFKVGDWEIFYTHQAIAAAYVVAGLTKLIKTSGGWIAQLPNITVQIAKTNDQFFYDSLSHPNPGLAEWIGNTIVAHPWVAYPLFAPGLLVELLAFCIPFGRKTALLMGVILLVMHGLISLVMQITFTTNIALIVIYLINIPWLLAITWRFGKGVFPGVNK